MGWQPRGCGLFVNAEPEEYRFLQRDIPLGEMSEH
jgi:hypothetical protein